MKLVAAILSLGLLTTTAQLPPPPTNNYPRGYVMLEWDQPNWSPASNAVIYWTNNQVVPNKISFPATNRYTVRRLVMGQEYSFFVTAIGPGFESEASNIAVGKAGVTPPKTNWFMTITHPQIEYEFATNILGPWKTLTNGVMSFTITNPPHQNMFIRAKYGPLSIRRESF